METASRIGIDQGARVIVDEEEAIHNKAEALIDAIRKCEEMLCSTGH